MKGAPDFPGFDSEKIDCNNHEFDPHVDFAQFLEEARRFADKKEVSEAESGKKQQELNQEKKQGKKKLWKLTALFSLWRTTEKKIKECPKQGARDSHSHFHPPNPRPRSHVSGPVGGAGSDAAASNKQYRRPASGPLTSLFHSKRREEISEIPYVSLDKLTKPQYDAKVYGPIYLVS